MKIIRDKFISLKKSPFINNDEGVTAIEFGILAVPFFALIAVILETATIFIAGMVLDNSLGDSSRFIRTGQAETANFDIDDFRDDLCSGTVGLFGDCSNIKISVKILPNFQSSNAAPQIIDPIDGSWEIVEQYDDGVGGSIIIAEVYYKWQPVIDFTWVNLGASIDGTRLLGAARVWRNEPF